MVLELWERSEDYVFEKCEARKKSHNPSGNNKGYTDWEKSLMQWSFEDGYKAACKDFEASVKYRITQNIQKLLRDFKTD